MQAAAVRLAETVRYAGAGTVEFIYDVDRGEFHSLEMNTRIQVGNPATEMITGIDLVEWQICQAAGALDAAGQLAQAPARHAIELRIYAERPEQNFLPAPGTISKINWPSEDGSLRIDHAVRNVRSVRGFCTKFGGVPKKCVHQGRKCRDRVGGWF